MADKSTLNEVKYPEGDDIGYRLKFYTDTDGYNLDHEDGDWASFDAALNNALDEIKYFKKYGTDIELIEIVKIITDEYITDDDEKDDYMEEEELLRSIPYDHKKYGWKVMSNLPSKSHTSYVIHQIMDWGRDYTDSDTFRSIKKIADACERYDDEYTAEEYEFVIRNAGLLSKATKNSRYRWNESLDETNKLTLKEDLFDEIDMSALLDQGYRIDMSVYNDSPQEDESLNEARDFEWDDTLWAVVKEDGRFAGIPCITDTEAREVAYHHEGSHIYKMTLDESLKEDLFLASQEPSEETPATPESNGVAKLILDAINDESDTIKMYNDLIANTDNEDIIKIIQDITAEENNHLGMLQKALEIVSPNASNIEDGVEEAESMISDDAPTADPEFVPLDDLFNDEEQHWPINESATVDISQFKPNSKIIAKLQDYYDRRSKINVRAIKGYPKALTYLYCMELFLNDIRNFTPTSDTSWEQKLELKKNKSYLEDMIWQLDDKAEELDVPREVIDDVIYEAQNDSTTLKPVTESLREVFNGNIIHIISDVDQIYPDGWDFPIEEVDYLLSEHPGETFVLAKDDSGKFRFWETSNSQTESLGEDLHSNFKKEIKDAYKKWASEVEEVEKLRKDAMDMIPEGATDEQINKYSDFINDMYPLPNKFNYEFPHNIENDDYPFYVTFYAEYPIYEPAEGGYYYAGADAIWSQGFDTKEDAQLYADAYVKNEKADFNEPWEQYADGYTLRGEYIGEDQRVVIEPRNAYLHGVKGWEPYQ